MSFMGIARAGARRRVFAIVVTVAVAQAAPAVADSADGRWGCAGATADPRSMPVEDIHETVLCLVNVVRARHDLPRLRLERRLEYVADRHARDMVVRRFFSHTNPDGEGLRDRVSETSYTRGRPWAVGENLAWGCGRRAQPAATVDAWMDSPPHRDILLTRRFRHLGVAVIRQAPDHPCEQGATYVAELGDR